MASYLPPLISGQFRKPRKLGLDGFREEIEEKKDEIKTHFKVYHDTLKETEAMLLGDLDAVLDKVTKEKEKESKELNEILITKQFIDQQMKQSNSEMLRKHAAMLEADIQRMKRDINLIMPVKIEWEHLDLCQMINEVGYISYPDSNEAAYSKKRDLIMSGAPSFYVEDYWDCTFDKNDQRIYLPANVLKVFENTVYRSPSDVGIETAIFVFDLSFKILPMINVSHPGYFSPAITTNEDYIFITAGINCENFILLISKFNHSQQVINTNIYGALGKSIVLGEYLFAVSTFVTNLHKFGIPNLKEERNIPLTGKREDGTNIQFSNAVDILTDDTLLYILFDSNALRSVCSFNGQGILIKEIVTNPRRLQNPTSFCLDTENHIIVADISNIRIFDLYGRPIASINYVNNSNYYSERSVTYDSINNHIIVLTNGDGDNLFAY